MATNQDIGRMGRVPPQNIEAERSVLGAMLQDREAQAAGLEILKPEHFYSGAHAVIFETIMELFERERVPVDQIIINNLLAEKGKLESVGGPGYIAGLLNVVPTVENAEHYARIVKQKAFLRAAIRQGDMMVEAAYRSESEDDILDFASRLPNIPDELEAFLGSDGVSTESAAQALYEQHRKIAERGYSGIKTGWRGLDRCLLEGLPTGYPMVLSGPPGMGKTAFLIQLLDQIAQGTGQRKNENIHRVLLYSLEMSRARVWSRRTSSKLYRLGYVHPDSFNESQIANTGRIIETNPKWRTVIEDETNWHIDDRTKLSFPQIIRGIRSFKRKHPDLKVVAIDHLGRVRLKSKTQQNQRERELAILGMADLAKELEILIAWVIQPDTKYLRDPGNRPPSVANLDYFTKAAQEAGVMLALVRPEGAEELTVYITKGRHGGTGGKVKMRFHMNVQTFEEDE